jgi:uncharacterized membrane protein YtjA (UPF0391 family)
LSQEVNDAPITHILLVVAIVLFLVGIVSGRGSLV